MVTMASPALQQMMNKCLLNEWMNRWRLQICMYELEIALIRETLEIQTNLTVLIMSFFYEDKKDNKKSQFRLSFDVEIILIQQGCHNKVPQTGWFKQQRFMFSQFWWLDVQD